MAAYDDLKELAYKANMDIPAQRLAIYTWGNASSFDPRRGVFAIKPSGVSYDSLTMADMVIVDLEGKTVEGTLKPSSDTKTHVELYRAWGNSGVCGVVHTHSAHATAWAQACRAIPLLGTTHADHLACEIPCAPYLSPEAIERDYEGETGKLIVSHFARLGLKPQEVPMVLLSGHGPFTWGKDAEKAVYNAAVLEEVARMAWISQSLNPGVTKLPDHIVDKHYQRKHGPKAYYGQ